MIESKVKYGMSVDREALEGVKSSAKKIENPQTAADRAVWQQYIMAVADQVIQEIEGNESNLRVSSLVDSFGC